MIQGLQSQYALHIQLKLWVEHKTYLYSSRLTFPPIWIHFLSVPFNFQKNVTHLYRREKKIFVGNISKNAFSFQASNPHHDRKKLKKAVVSHAEHTLPCSWDLILPISTNFNRPRKYLFSIAAELSNTTSEVSLSYFEVTVSLSKFERHCILFTTPGSILNVF